MRNPEHQSASPTRPQAQPKWDSKFGFHQAVLGQVPNTPKLYAVYVFYMDEI